MKNLIIILLITISQNCIAQNLVINPSFEAGANCDGKTERIDTVDGWTPLAGRPGYINTNCTLSKDSKSFVQGMKLPPAAHKDVLNILKLGIKGEFQQGRLTTALEKDKQYIIKMFVRLPIQFCSTAVKEIGVVLSEELLEVSEERRAIDIPATALQNNSQSLLKKQYDWEEVTALYKAKGGEKYIAIGNFSNINPGIFEARGEKECTYIFIDLVSVTEFTEIDLPEFNSDMSIKKGQRLLLSGVEFEEGTDILRKNSHEILKSLAKTLKDNPKMKVEVSSHCDNSLDAMKSITFTKARAKKVAEYLTDNDVLSSQLTEIGKGSMEAIALNNSAKGRKKNERIEIRVLEL